MLIGYDMFRNLALGSKMKNKTSKEALAKYLLDPGNVLAAAFENVQLVFGLPNFKAKLCMPTLTAYNLCLDCPI